MLHDSEYCDGIYCSLLSKRTLRPNVDGEGNVSLYTRFSELELKNKTKESY